jgi:hypothetical protein
MGLHDCSNSDSFGFHEQLSPAFPPAVPAELSDPRIGSYLLTENYMLAVARRPEIWKDPPMHAGTSALESGRPWVALDENPPYSPHAIPAWPEQTEPPDNRGAEIDRRYIPFGAAFPAAAAASPPPPPPPPPARPSRFQTFST